MQHCEQQQCPEQPEHHQVNSALHGEVEPAVGAIELSRCDERERQQRERAARHHAEAPFPGCKRVLHLGFTVTVALRVEACRDGSYMGSTRAGLAWNVPGVTALSR